MLDFLAKKKGGNLASHRPLSYRRIKASSTSTLCELMLIEILTLKERLIPVSGMGRVLSANDPLFRGALWQ